MKGRMNDCRIFHILYHSSCIVAANYWAARTAGASAVLWPLHSCKAPMCGCGLLSNQIMRRATKWSYLRLLMDTIICCYGLATILMLLLLLPPFLMLMVTHRNQSLTTYGEIAPARRWSMKGGRNFSLFLLVVNVWKWKRKPVSEASRTVQVSAQGNTDRAMDCLWLNWRRRNAEFISNVLSVVSGKCLFQFLFNPWWSHPIQFFDLQCSGRTRKKSCLVFVLSTVL